MFLQKEGKEILPVNSRATHTLVGKISHHIVS